MAIRALSTGSIPDWGQGHHQNESHCYASALGDQHDTNRGSLDNDLTDRTSDGESEPLIIVTAECAAEILPQIRNAPQAIGQSHLAEGEG